MKRVLFFTGCLFCSTLGLAQYKEVASELKIDHAHYSTILMGGGVVFFDFNNDELLDIYLTGGIERDRLYINQGTGRYLDYSDSSGIKDIMSGYETFGVIAGDINNDGCVDLFITTLGRTEPNKLLLNNCDSTFTDISVSAGITHTVASTSAAFIDYNKDGYLDIYVGNYIDELKFLFDENGETTGFAHKCFADFFYENQGNETFIEKAGELGIANTGCTLAVISSDFDLDNDQDIYVANDFGEWVIPNVLYENNTFGFEENSELIGLDIPLYGMGIGVVDYELDGDWDYYITNLGKNYFMVQNDSGEYVDKSDELQIADKLADDGKLATGWAAIFFDDDNDANHDLFVANGYIPSAPFIQSTLFDKNRLFAQDNNGKFSDLTVDKGLGSDRMNRGGAVGDFDNDGDLDLIVQTVATAYNPDSKIKTLVYRNLLESNNYWLQIRLVGTTSNRDAFGAIARLYAGGKMYMQEVYSGGTHASQNSTILHFGLGTNSAIDSLVIRWPAGGLETFKDIPVNQRLHIIEGQNSYEIMGCTDPESENYNPLATYSTGCYIQGIFGCTDPDAINYLPDANVDDGSCYYGEVVTGLKTEESSRMRVYPSPFEEYLKIEINDIRAGYLRVVGLTGDVLVEESWQNGNSYWLDTSFWRKGVYFIEIITESGEIYSKKVLKI